MWCLSFAREATPHLVRADRVQWLARLDAELPNLLAALSGALEDGHGDVALQLAGELGTYWWRTGHGEAGRPWIDIALQQAAGASARARANTLLCRARLYGVRESQPYVADARAALELFRACDDPSGISACLAHLSDAEAWLGHFDQARALLDDAMQFAERAHDEEAVALVLMYRGLGATGFELASRRSRDAIDCLRRLGNLLEVAHLCNWSGYWAIVERRYREADVWLNEGLEAIRPLRHLNFVFLIRGNQGLTSLFLDELDEAAQAFSDALAVCREAGCEDIVDEALLGVAAVAARRGELDGAACLAGAAKGHQTASRSGGEDVIWARLNDEILTAARDRFGPENWDRAEREGASLGVPEAIDLALVRVRSAPVSAARESSVS
jgi:tetratricopeptide (TPR) repeat protein